MDTITYKLIKTWFEKKYYKHVAVACVLVNISNIEEEKQSYFYYMWGRSLRLTDKKEKALELFAKSLSYNDIAPNASLWEYASTLYEVYEHDEITEKKILKPFTENGYRMDTITYKLIKTWFEKKHYKHVAVAVRFFDTQKIEKNLLSNYYLMCAESSKKTYTFLDALYYLKKYKETSITYTYVNKKMEAELLEYLGRWDEALSIWKSMESSRHIPYDFVLGKIFLCLVKLERIEEYQKYKKILHSLNFNNTLYDKNLGLVKLDTLLPTAM